MKKIVALLLLSFSVQAGVTLDWEINLLDKINDYESQPYEGINYTRIMAKLNNNNLIVSVSLFPIINNMNNRYFILSSEDGSIVYAIPDEPNEQIILFSEGNFAYDSNSHNDNPSIYFLNANGEYENQIVTNYAISDLGAGFVQEKASDILYVPSQDYYKIRKYTITSDNPTPTLSAQTSSGFNQDNYVINWDSSSGAQYQIQSSTDLTNWVDVGSTLIGTGEMMTWANHVTNSQAFFRVVKD